jgi:hypothetical protein
MCKAGAYHSLYSTRIMWYLFYRYNQDSSCSQPLAASGYVNNHCFGDQDSSTMFDYPYRYSYDSSDCTGTATVHQVDEDTCSFMAESADDVYDFAKDNSYESFFHYGATSDVSSGDKPSSLSAGVIAGIITGCTVGFVAVFGCLMWWFKGEGSW